MGMDNSCHIRGQKCSNMEDPNNEMTEAIVVIVAFCGGVVVLVLPLFDNCITSRHKKFHRFS